MLFAQWETKHQLHCRVILKSVVIFCIGFPKAEKYLSTLVTGEKATTLHSVMHFSHHCFVSLQVIILSLSLRLMSVLNETSRQINPLLPKKKGKVYYVFTDVLVGTLHKHPLYVYPSLNGDIIFIFQICFVIVAHLLLLWTVIFFYICGWDLTSITSLWFSITKSSSSKC